MLHGIVQTAKVHTQCSSTLTMVICIAI